MRRSALDTLRLRKFCGLVLALGLLLGIAQAGTIRVHYDTGFGHFIAIRGSVSPLSWTVGKKSTWTTGNVWTLAVPSTIGRFEFKALVDDRTWSVGANLNVVPSGNSVVDIYPFFGAAKGTLKEVTGIYSPQLGEHAGPDPVSASELLG